MDKKENFIKNCIAFMFIFCLSFSFITKSVNPFIFSSAFALIFAGVNIIVVILGVVLGLLLYFKTYLSLLVILNLTSCLILYSIICKIIKKRKISDILGYILLIIAQIVFIYLNFNSKTNIISSVLSCFSSILFFYIYKTIFSSILNKKLDSIYTIDEKICGFIGLTSVFLGISNLSVCNFYFIYIIAFITIYFSSLILDFKHSLIISLCAGLPQAIIYSNILSLSLFLIFAIISKLTSVFNKYYMVIITSVADLLLGLVFNAYFSYSYINLIYLFVSGLIIILIPNRVYNNLKGLFNRNNNLFLDKAYSGFIHENEMQIFNKLKNSLINLKNFYKLNLFKSATKEDFINFLGAEIINNNCTMCSMNCSFSLDKIKELIEYSLINNLSINNLPANFNTNCIFLQKIISEINDSIVDFNNNNKKAQEYNEKIMCSLENINCFYNIIDVIDKNKINKKEYKKISKNTIINEFAYYFIIVKEVLVLEDENNIKEIFLIMNSNFTKTILAGDILSKIFKQKIIFNSEKNINIYGYKMLIFKTMPKYTISFGACQKSKQEKCGDSYAFLKNTFGSNFIALADGMGTGKIASEKSKNVIDIISNLVYYNIDLNNLALILNNLFIKTNSAVFSTLDLAQIDLYSGKLDLIKLASPISIIKRQEKLEVLSGKSLPVGVLETIEPTIIKTYLSSGDFLIICSDGIVDSLTEEGLFKLINTTPLLSSQLLAETIVEESFYLGNNLDDLTCVVIKII